jgi:ArsR family transcriptional regulator, arsenate/arsenite/antimonite-responsive transcriptional repressor
MNELLKISGSVYDETRVAILVFLLKYGECCVCELSASLGLGQSRISRHLGLLQDAGFLIMSRHGRWVYYAIVSEPNEIRKSILNYITSLSLQLPEKIDACNISKGKNSEKCTNTLHG